MSTDRELGYDHAVLRLKAMQVHDDEAELVYVFEVDAIGDLVGERAT